jgi:hypothetical protein
MILYRAFNYPPAGVLQPENPSHPSYSAHGKVPHLKKTCAECFSTFPTNANLEQHASGSGHTAFPCTCGALFSRASTLTRHINSMIGPKFRCDLCDEKTFPRLDKLAEHLRRWHRLGAKALDRYKGGNSAVSSSASLASGGTPPLPSENLQVGQFSPGQFHDVATGPGTLSMFDKLPSLSTTAADASSVGSSVSPDSFTVCSRTPRYCISDSMS